MPFGNEETPNRRYHIDFKPLEDLIDDNDYQIFYYPSLEQPRQLSLASHEFDIINRDYCIVQSPGKTSWQQPESRENPEIKIFYTDTVKIPKSEALEKFQPSGYNVSTYESRWYLQGMTRVNVERLFKRHFNLTIPLSGESLSAHWMPCPIVYNVEVSEDVWENRLVLFFDGNVETSMMPLTTRTNSYGQQMASSKLGERYLNIWRSRWETKVEMLPFPESTHTKAAAVLIDTRQAPSLEIDAPPSSWKHRGRRRKALRRQLQGAPNTLTNKSCTDLDILKEDVILPKAIHTPRGRLRRRERRKKRGEQGPEGSDNEDVTLNTTSKASVAVTPSADLNSVKQMWKYNSMEAGIIGSWRSPPRIPAIALIRFGASNPISPDLSTHQLPGVAGEVVLPRITLQSSIESLHPPRVKRYRVMYEGTDPVDSEEIPQSTATDADMLEIKPEETEADISVSKHRPIHVADLIDEVDFVSSGGYDEKLFISSFDSDPLSIKRSSDVELADLVFSSHQESASTDITYNEYWQKFSILTCGYTYPTDIREAPYSHGYGSDHSNPELIRRVNRWGYYDVDNVCDKSGRPRWRAAWKFKLLRNGLELCSCTWAAGIPHNLNNCRYLVKEFIDPRAYYSAQGIPHTVLSDVLYFVHSPFELLRNLGDILHLYWPSQVPPKEVQDKTREDENASEEVGNEADEPRDSKPQTDDSEGVSQLSPVKVNVFSEESIASADDTVGKQQEGDDLEFDSTSDKLPVTEVVDKEPIVDFVDEPVVSRQLQRSEEVEFEMGICYLMGLGVLKDYQKGIGCIMDSANMGCLRGRAVLSRLASVYNVELEIPGNILEGWLSEASRFGSQIAVADLERLFPRSFKEFQAHKRFVFDFKHPHTFDYMTDLSEHFNLSDPTRLVEQLRKIKSPKKEVDGAGPHPQIEFSGVKSLNVMARISNEHHKEKKDRYYIYGSLLHLAALFGFEESISTLLDFGFDVNGHASNPALRTPLLCALSRGYSSIAKHLIKKGADCQAVMLWGEDDICITPSPLHYLVNIENGAEAVELARLLVKGGADVNYKCSSKLLQNDLDLPVLTGKSVTPLRWAVMHENVRLVKVLLSLGAKFAYEPYMRNQEEGTTGATSEQKGCLLLETPCTNIDILEMFFARARVPGLPIEFSQTPLGLLVSEDDAPEQRLRSGFDNQDKIVDAVRLLLELQPGHEEVFLWSTVRHDQEIIRFLLEDLGWNVESRWKGLTCLQTAVIYGHKNMVEYLLSMGADATAKTETRHLSCLHLLALVPRHHQTDLEILELLKQDSVDLDAKEKIDNLTALHFAVRNQKFELARELLRMGADRSASVSDQLRILSQGRGRYLETVSNFPLVFTSSLKLLGEVVIRYIQEGFYPVDYVADVIVLFLDSNDGVLTKEDLVIDQGNGMSLLHLLAVIPHRDDRPFLSRKEWHKLDHWNPAKPPPMPIEAEITLLQLALLRTPKDLIGLRDDHGDTPLQYACAARQVHNIKALLSFGSDPHLKNKIGLPAVEILALSTIFLGGKTMSVTSHIGEPQWGNVKEYDWQRTLIERTPFKSPSGDIEEAFALFKGHGLTVDERLYHLALAWACAAPVKDRNGQPQERGKSSSLRMVLVPEDVDGMEFEPTPEEQSPTFDIFGRHTGDRKHNYYFMSLEGPDRVSKEEYRSEFYEEKNKATEEREAL